MPSDVALVPIYAALKALLVAHAPLTAMLAVKTAGAGGGPGVYDDNRVTQGALMPYLTIGAGTQIDDHTMGPEGSLRYGWNCTLQIKAIGQISEAAGLTIMSAVMTVLYDGRALTVSGYGNSWCDKFTIQPSFTTTQAGVVTSEWPGILRVFAFD